MSRLSRYINNYEEWLDTLEEECLISPSEEQVPTKTYFLVRKSDNKIIGMTNIRLALNDNSKNYCGHIGYSIRPTERLKGYNKINLYLGLNVCHTYGIEKILMVAEKSNIASCKTIEALGGICIREDLRIEEDICIVKKYEIDVNKSINNNSNIYESLVLHNSISKKVFVAS